MLCTAQSVKLGIILKEKEGRRTSGPGVFETRESVLLYITVRPPSPHPVLHIRTKSVPFLKQRRRARVQHTCVEVEACVHCQVEGIAVKEDRA